MTSSFGLFLTMESISKQQHNSSMNATMSVFNHVCIKAIVVEYVLRKNQIFRIKQKYRRFLENDVINCWSSYGSQLEGIWPHFYWTLDIKYYTVQI